MRLPRLVLFALFAVAPLARATTMIYPVEAIDDLWNLPADDFKAKYAGINITGLGPSDEGWYVRYKHENLTILFGPLADREAARSKKWDMETVRDAAIRNRQALASSQVDFVRFTFSGVYGKGGDGTGNGGKDGRPTRARISADGKSGPDGDLDGDGIPNSKDPDMDGDGIPNELDDDVDGDGIPNGKDDYMYGKDPGVDGYGNGVEGLAKEDGSGGDGDGKDGKGGKGGKGGKDGNGNGGDGDQLAGDGDGSGNGKGGSKSGSKMGGKNGQGGDGDDGDGSDGSGGGGGQSGSKGRQVASAKRGGQGGSSGSSGGQSGSQGSQSGSQGGQQGGGGSSGGMGQPGGGSSGPGMPSSGGGGGGNPLQLLTGLLKMILGI